MTDLNWIILIVGIVFIVSAGIDAYLRERKLLPTFVAVLGVIFTIMALFWDSNNTDTSDNDMVNIKDILLGTWSGEYTHNQGITSLDLIITNYINGTITAYFYFSAHPNNPDIQSGMYSMRGTISEDMTISLIGQEWETEQPYNWTFLNIFGVLDIDNRVISSDEGSLSVNKISNDTDRPEIDPPDVDPTMPSDNGDDKFTRLVDITSNSDFFPSRKYTDNYRSRQYTEVLRTRLRRFQFITLLGGRYTSLRGTLFVPYGAQDGGGYLTITFEFDDSVKREPEVYEMWFDTHPIEIDIELIGVDKLSISTHGHGAPWVQFAYFRLYP